MLVPRPQDAIHKAHLCRILTGLLDNPKVASGVYFKGGSCAAMLGFLDRFSVDLDFDLKREANKKFMHQEILAISKALDFEIKQKSPHSLFYVLKYQAPAHRRSTIKLSIIDYPLTSNVYEPYYLPQIDRYALCQTKEVMFAHKLVAVMDRYRKYRTIAGRDVYDIHSFFLQGFRYRSEVIEERVGKSAERYLSELTGFIEKKVTQKSITEDLSYLLSPKKFDVIRKTLKSELLVFLKDELSRLRP